MLQPFFLIMIPKYNRVLHNVKKQSLQCFENSMINYGSLYSIIDDRIYSELYTKMLNDYAD